VREVVGHRRSVASGVWRGRRGIWVLRALRQMAPPPLGIYDPPFAASMDFRLLSHTPQTAQPSCYILICSLNPAMAFVNLDSIHQYQPPPIVAQPVQRHSASMPLQGRSEVWNRGASTVSSGYNKSVGLASNSTTSANLQDSNAIEYVDLTTSLPMETLDPSREPALGFGGMENAQGNVYCSQCR